MLELMTTSFDALLLAGLTSLVLYELVEVAAPRFAQSIRRR